MAGDFDFKTTSFKFSGFPELYRLLDKLSEGTKARELAPLLKEGVEPFRSTAEALAPDDLKTPDPDLESSIVISTRQRSGRAKHDRKLGRFDARVYIGPSGNTRRGGKNAAYPQAIMQEFGWVNGPAQPFMRPAYDAQKVNVVRIIEANYRAHILTIAQKYGWA